MKIYQNKHGMKAIVKDDGTAVWLDTLQPIYSKIDLTQWVELQVVYQIDMIRNFLRWLRENDWLYDEFDDADFAMVLDWYTP